MCTSFFHCLYVCLFKKILKLVFILCCVKKNVHESKRNTNFWKEKQINTKKKSTKKKTCRKILAHRKKQTNKDQIFIWSQCKWIFAWFFACANDKTNLYKWWMRPWHLWCVCMFRFVDFIQSNAFIHQTSLHSHSDPVDSIDYNWTN